MTKKHSFNKNIAKFKADAYICEKNYCEMRCVVNILMLMLIEDIKRLWLGCNSHDILAHFANRYFIAFRINGVTYYPR